MSECSARCFNVSVYVTALEMFPWPRPSVCLLIRGALPSQRTGLPSSLFSFCLFIYVPDSKMGACPVRHDAGISRPRSGFSNILVMGVNGAFGTDWEYSVIVDFTQT